MSMCTRTRLLVVWLILGAVSAQAADDWIELFDGTFHGWRAAEHKGSWKIEDGSLVTRGPRSHLFYVGPLRNHTFKNLELRLEVMTEPGSNSGVYVHTRYQESGWPSRGYECQVINSAPTVAPGEYVERKMTGSIYGVRNLWKAPVPDGQWFDYRIVVQGRTLRTYIDGRLMAEYTEPEDLDRTRGGRVLTAGTVALQCHDPKSVVRYRRVRIKLLPDDLPTPGVAPADRAFDSVLRGLAGRNIPLMDLHVHLKGGLTLDEALANARRYGFTYGIAVNGGLKMTCPDEASLRAFLDGYDKPPQTFLALQAEGREWRRLFAAETVARFDYVFTDAMTWTNDAGKRMRLWIPEETEIGDPQDFMEQLVRRIETIFSTEPVDIYVNPTYLPDALAERYDELWTPARMDRVIAVLVKHGVALEINNRRRLPSEAFIKRAKAAGVKFTLGTNNGGRDDLGRMDYGVEMIKACGLRGGDLWRPQDRRR